jgi:Predicted membrane protein
MINAQNIFYAFLGGLLPAVIWLVFWLREDAKRPEPKGRIIETFLAGMVVVVLVLPFQRIVADNFPGYGFIPFFLWSSLEEIFKFLAAYIVALRSFDDDEPLDPLIYMITAALGFVALENALFILNPLLEQNVTVALLTGGTRFLGASLLHIIASGVVGVSLAFAFFKSRGSKILYGLFGVLIAIAIHTAFNLFVLNNSGESLLGIFGFVWLGVALLLLFFEKIKTIAP